MQLLDASNFEPLLTSLEIAITIDASREPQLLDTRNFEPQLTPLGLPSPSSPAVKRDCCCTVDSFSHVEPLQQFVQFDW